MRVDLASGTAENLTPGVIEVSDFAISRDYITHMGLEAIYLCLYVIAFTAIPMCVIGGSHDAGFLYGAVAV